MKPKPNPHAFASALLLPLLGAAALGLSGCSTTLAKIDQSHMRDRLMEYTEEQIMDNLIRAKEHRAIVHFDPTKISAQVKTGLAGTIGGGQTLTRSATLLGQSVVSAVRPFTFSANPTRDNTIGLDVTAVLDKNEVYAAYEYFVSLDGSVVKGRAPNVPETDPDAEHVGQRGFNGKYYHVPKRYAEDYFQLCLRVAAKRGAVEGGAVAAGKTGPAKPSSTPWKSRAVPGPLRSPDVSPSSILSPDVKALEDAVYELRQLRLR